MKSIYPTANIGPDTGWKLLGIAVVAQAVQDWRLVNDTIKKNGDTSAQKIKLKREAEKFLRSPLCDFYSNLDGKTILRKLQCGAI